MASPVFILSMLQCGNFRKQPQCLMLPSIVNRGLPIGVCDWEPNLQSGRHATNPTIDRRGDENKGEEYRDITG